MKQAADRNVPSQFVVPFDCFPGLEHVHFHSFSLQQLKRFRADLKPFVDALGEYYRSRAVIQQLLHVGWLNAGNVGRAGFRPVPFAGAAGIELGVLIVPVRTHFDSSPGQGDDLRGLWEAHFL